MSSVVSTIDAGSFSQFCCNLLHTRFVARARRRRAQTSTSSKTPSSSRMDNPLAPSRGIFKKRAYAAGRRGAASVLVTKRQDLKKVLQDSMRSSTPISGARDRIRQLVGPLDLLPKPRAREIKSAEDMEMESTQKAAILQRKSGLRRVETLRGGDEIEFGLLPGEKKGDEERLVVAEFEIELGKARDEEVMEELEYPWFFGMGLVEIGDVWRWVVVQRDEPVEMVAQKAREESFWAAAAKAGAVMDRQCVNVVKGVWEMAGGRK